MEMTAKELGNMIGVSDKGARSLIIFLEEAKCAKNIGTKKNTGSSRGAPANNYAVDITECKKAFDSMIITLTAPSPEQKPAKPLTQDHIIDIAPRMDFDEVDAAEVDAIDAELADVGGNLKDYPMFESPSMDELPEFGDNDLDIKYTPNDF